MSKDKRQLTKRIGLTIVVFLILLVACTKKKPVESEQLYYIEPAEEIDLTDDDELDDLPEAGEDTDEDY